jgi:DNA-binding response OmpR family regulator
MLDTTIKTILIVEDENSLSEVLKETLIDHGYSVTVKNNGEEGLVEAVQNHPQLILLDILMPKMDGLQMLAHLREKQTQPKSAIIFFTNLNQVDKIADALKEGAEGYIIKADASLDEIVKRVDDFFLKQENEQEK